MKDYNYYLGSLTDYLLNKDICNETMIGILLDFKTCWEVLAESGIINTATLCETLSDMFCDYSQGERTLLSSWMLASIIEHPAKGAYNFIN